MIEVPYYMLYYFRLFVTNALLKLINSYWIFGITDDSWNIVTGAEATDNCIK